MHHMTKLVGCEDENDPILAIKLCKTRNLSIATVGCKKSSLALVVWVRKALHSTLGESRQAMIFPHLELKDHRVHNVGFGR